MTLFARVTFIFALLVGSSPVTLGQYSIDHPCLQSDSAGVILAKDPSSGNFTVVHRMKPGVSLSLPGVQFRHLELENMSERNDDRFLRNQLVAIPGILADDELEGEASRRRLQDGAFWNDLPDFGSDDLYYAWECSCHEDHIATVYCPLDIDTCLRPYRWSSGRIPGCRNLPKAYDFRRYTFLFMLAWFFALLTALVTSKLGRSLFGYFMSKCFPSWNERVVDRLIERHPERVRDMIRLYLIREQRALNEARRHEEIAQADTTQENSANAIAGEAQHTVDEGGDVEPKDPPTSLVLRTKIYRTVVKIPEEEQVDTCSDTEEDQCAICFLPFEDGDKVGLLKCSHLFHSDCLKLWLQRRNACPLCQLKDIADPRYEEILSDTEASTTHADDTITSSSEEAPST